MANEMSFGSTDVWDRRGEGGTMTQGAFVATVCFWTSVGMGLSALCARWAMTMHLHAGAYIAAMILPFVGSIIAMKSKNAAFSLLGFVLVAAPFGFITGPLVAMYTAASVTKVMTITVGVTLCMGILGAAIPRALQGFGMWLFGGLMIMIVGGIAMWIMSMFGINVRHAMTALDWFGVVLFSGYVLYDVNRAMFVERTPDNAIDCALAIYLDIFNLFIRLLRLMGQRRD